MYYLNLYWLYYTFIILKNFPAQIVIRVILTQTTNSVTRILQACAHIVKVPWVDQSQDFIRSLQWQREVLWAKTALTPKPCTIPLGFTD